jgi:hypothetical protein
VRRRNRISSGASCSMRLDWLNEPCVYVYCWSFGFDLCHKCALYLSLYLYFRLPQLHCVRLDVLIRRPQSELAEIDDMDAATLARAGEIWDKFARLDRVPAVREAALANYVRATSSATPQLTELLKLKLRDVSASVRTIAERELVSDDDL